MTSSPSPNNSTELHKIARGYCVAVAKPAMESNSSLLQNKSMTVSATRLKNVRLLMQDHLRDAPTQKEFAELVGCTANSFNQYITGHRTIGGTVARRIEKRLAKDAGWMDMPHPQEWEELRNYDGYRPPEPGTQDAKAVAARLEALSDDELTEHVLYLIRLAERRHAAFPADLAPRKDKPD